MCNIWLPVLDSSQIGCGCKEFPGYKKTMDLRKDLEVKCCLVDEHDYVNC